MALKQVGVAAVESIGAIKGKWRTAISCYYGKTKGLLVLDSSRKYTCTYVCEYFSARMLLFRFRCLQLPGSPPLAPCSPNAISFGLKYSEACSAVPIRRIYFYGFFGVIKKLCVFEKNRTFALTYTTLRTGSPYCTVLFLAFLLRFLMWLLLLLFCCLERANERFW